MFLVLFEPIFLFYRHYSKIISSPPESDKGKAHPRWVVLFSGIGGLNGRQKGLCLSRWTKIHRVGNGFIILNGTKLLFVFADIVVQSLYQPFGMLRG